MLFDVKQFEQFFKEKPLKKGLKIFEKGELELVERQPGFEYYFLVSDKNLHLKKKGDKLINFSCSCAKDSYCEHLSAAMFYFQQEALGISVKNKTTNNVLGLKQSYGTTYNTLKKAEKETLFKFIQQHNNLLFSSSVTTFLSDKTAIGLSDVYSAQIEVLIEPYSTIKKLDDTQIGELTSKIQGLVKKIEKQIQKEKERFNLYLAIIQAYTHIFNMRFSGDEKPIFGLYYKTLENLDESFKKGLSVKEKTEWFRATLNIIESNKNLQGEAFMFLIPRFVNVTKSEPELALLTSILKKRVYKIPYSHPFDKLLIARFEVALKEHELFKTSFSLQQEQGEIELILAKAELDLCTGKADKAFNLLESNYENVRAIYKNYYKEYLDYIISNARKNRRSDLEIKYLCESFIHGLFILSPQLDRFLELIPKEEQLEKLKEIIERIKAGSRGYYFDKISVLFLRANLLDELIRELAKQNNKFSLVHEIALKKFPEYTHGFLTLYMKHLADTLKQDSIYNYQLQVFNTAKIFLDMLPEKVVIELIKKLLDQVGKTGHLYRYINELYDYPFLKEEGNY